METSKYKARIYYVAIFILYFVIHSVNSKIINFPTEFVNAVQIFAMFLFAIEITKISFRRDVILYIFLLTGVALYEFVTIGNFMFLSNIVIILALKNVDIKKIVKIDILVKTFYLLLHIAVYYYCYFFDRGSIASSMYFSASVGFRSSILFSHPNAAGGIAIFLALDIFYIMKDKKLGGIMASAVVFMSYFITKTRTTLVIYAIFVLVYLVLNRKIIGKFIERSYKYLTLTITGLMTALCVIPNILNNEIVKTINKLLSYRLKYSVVAIKEYGINFMPNNIADNLLDHVIKVDNFYVRCFIEYGVIMLVVLNILYFLATFKRKNSRIDKAILIIFPIYLITEMFPINAARSICMLVLGNILINSKKGPSIEGEKLLSLINEKLEDIDDDDELQINNHKLELSQNEIECTINKIEKIKGAKDSVEDNKISFINTPKNRIINFSKEIEEYEKI